MIEQKTLEEAYNEGKRDGRSVASWRKETERLVKESNLALLERVKLGLEDYIDEARVGNDMAWRQVIHFDDVDTVFEAIRKEYE